MPGDGDGWMRGGTIRKMVVESREEMAMEGPQGIGNRDGGEEGQEEVVIQMQG